jgi:transposase-like protein
MNLLYQRLRRPNSGQVTPFLIAIMVIVLVAALVFINLGQIALDKINTANASDSAALAGSSMLASALNQIADIRNWARIESGILLGYLAAAAAALAVGILGAIFSFGISLAAGAAFALNMFINAMISGVIILGFYIVARGLEREGLTNARLFAAKFALANTAIPEEEQINLDKRLADLSGEYWNQPGRKVVTFSWEDDEGRSHAVSVEIDSPRNLGLSQEAAAYEDEKGELHPVGWLEDAAYSLLNLQPSWEAMVPSLTQLDNFFSDLQEFADSLPQFTLWPWDGTEEALGMTVAGSTEARNAIAVRVTRSGWNADVGLWNIRLPTMTASTLAEAVGSGGFFQWGPNYDNHIIRTDASAESRLGPGEETEESSELKELMAQLEEKNAQLEEMSQQLEEKLIELNTRIKEDIAAIGKQLIDTASSISQAGYGDFGLAGIGERLRELASKQFVMDDTGQQAKESGVENPIGLVELREELSKIIEDLNGAVSQIGGAISDLAGQIADKQAELAATPPTITYSETVQVGEDEQGNPIYETYTWEEPNPAYVALQNEIAELERRKGILESGESSANSSAGSLEAIRSEIESIRQFRDEKTAGIRELQDELEELRDQLRALTGMA